VTLKLYQIPTCNEGGNDGVEKGTPRPKEPVRLRYPLQTVVCVTVFLDRHAMISHMLELDLAWIIELTANRLG